MYNKNRGFYCPPCQFASAVLKDEILSVVDGLVCLVPLPDTHYEFEDFKVSSLIEAGVTPSSINTSCVNRSDSASKAEPIINHLESISNENQE